jgi:D-amino-acid dehydrogenase
MFLKTNLRVDVVGAGITGITTAFSKLGCCVSVYDRHGYSAMETSYANGGQLSASNSEVWNSWGNVAKAIKWMVIADAPLLLGARPSWHKATWFTEFLSAIAKYEENTIATAKLAVSARQFLKKWPMRRVSTLTVRIRLSCTSTAPVKRSKPLHVYRNF